MTCQLKNRPDVLKKVGFFVKETCNSHIMRQEIIIGMVLGGNESPPRDAQQQSVA